MEPVGLTCKGKSRIWRPWPLNFLRLEPPRYTKVGLADSRPAAASAQFHPRTP